MPSPVMKTPLRSNRSTSDMFGLHAESPLAPGILKAQEDSNKMMNGAEMEKVLLERLLLRKDYRLKNIEAKLSETEAEFEKEKAEKDVEISGLRDIIAENNKSITKLQSEYVRLLQIPGLQKYIRCVEGLHSSRDLCCRSLGLIIKVLIFPFYTVPKILGEKLCQTSEYTLLYLRKTLLRWPAITASPAVVLEPEVTGSTTDHTSNTISTPTHLKHVSEGGRRNSTASSTTEKRKAKKKRYAK